MVQEKTPISWNHISTYHNQFNVAFTRIHDKHQYHIPSSDFQCCFEQGSVKKCTKATEFFLPCSKTLDIPADDCTCRLCGIWAMMWYVFSLLYCFGRSFRVMPYHRMILIFTMPSSLQVSPGHLPKRPVDAQILLVVYALPAYVADITPALLNVTAELQT